MRERGRRLIVTNHDKVRIFSVAIGLFKSSLFGKSKAYFL